MSRREFDEAAMAWRSAVLDRDGRSCTQCGAKNRLHAHHIKPFSTHLDSRYDISNGITLCTTCHGERHPNQKGLINSTRYNRIGSTSRGATGIRRNFKFSHRHDAILLNLSSQLGISLTDTLQRALEELQVKEAHRNKLINWQA